ncbi:transporter substrate-binding domain-containing protein [Acidisoma cellulosilytica]|uniref:Transporter substrate-binding domain-containing protein n=1 Tax=Acidisoma cellulosilyticum TaxID=2802395 RepID=A0A963Z3F6_9PROT|nr:transporter substrate-binding domain-containing protein [Acidisoma cellulosilyticum]MCB8882118.1 transporter substrate-binding domain-containing protein [Acidisoma cellulosilyticum]
MTATVRPASPLRAGLRLLLIVVSLCLPLSARAANAPAPLQPASALSSPDVALAKLLAEAHTEAAHSCIAPTSRLVAILCAGSIRIGVRDNYPPFAVMNAHGRAGFEIAIAQRIGAMLGVKTTLVTVTPADRIAALAEGRIDVTIATMGDTTLRDSQARFIRPHYYASSTAIIGAKSHPALTLRTIGGRTICVTVGDSSNPGLAEAGARLLLFASPEQLVDELNSGTCALIAQDDTFFARYFTDPRFRSLYSVKFTVDPLPWGMATPIQDGAQLADALALMSEIFHRDGVFLKLAQANALGLSFLTQQRAVWLRRDCNAANGFTNSRCVLPPHRSDMTETRFAGAVDATQNWLAERLGLQVGLEIFKLQPAWDLVREGIRNSLILVFGTLLSTLAFALLIGRALSLQSRLLRWPMRGVVMLLQSTPPVLSLVIAASAANAIFAFSSTLAISAAILALGLINGGNAGQAISEALASLREEQQEPPLIGPPMTETTLYIHALRRSVTQIMSFLINATKATPMASFIGAPELLNALTDSTSFSSDREATYWLMLIFYVLVVLIVVWICGRTRFMLERYLNAA